MLHAQRVLDELKKLQITHVVGLPDNTTAAFVARLKHDHSIQFIGVTREGEAFAIAAGLWMGGASPLVMIQNTGLLEAGDALRGTVERMRVPLLCLISYRGYDSLTDAPPLEASPWGADELSRASLDTAALMLEPTLKAWALPFDFLNDDVELDKIAATLQRAQAERRPFALLVPNAMG